MSQKVKTEIFVNVIYKLIYPFTGPDSLVVRASASGSEGREFM